MLSPQRLGISLFRASERHTLGQEDSKALDFHVLACSLMIREQGKMLLLTWRAFGQVDCLLTWSRPRAR